ncbi:hypothetical protein ACFL3V_06300 [Nanoarchaeota archaeon]
MGKKKLRGFKNMAEKLKGFQDIDEFLEMLLSGRNCFGSPEIFREICREYILSWKI